MPVTFMGSLPNHKRNQLVQSFPKGLFMPIRIFLISNFRLILDGIAALIAMESDRFQLAGIAVSFEQAMESIAGLQADIILFDIDSADTCDALSLIDGLQVKAASDIKILLFTRWKNVVLNDKAILLGARGVIGKDASSEQLFDACAKVVAGEIWLDRMATGRIFEEFSRRGRNNPNHSVSNKAAVLTDKEMKVIVAIVKSSEPGKVIASELGISESTLRNKLTGIYEKLGVHNRQGLFAFARENGLI